MTCDWVTRLWNTIISKEKAHKVVISHSKVKDGSEGKDGHIRQRGEEGWRGVHHAMAPLPRGIVCSASRNPRVQRMDRKESENRGMVSQSRFVFPPKISNTKRPCWLSSSCKEVKANSPAMVLRELQVTKQRLE